MKFDSLDQKRYLRTFGVKADLLLPKTDRVFYKKEEDTPKKYSFLYRNETNSNQTEFYNGGKYYIPKTPAIEAKK